jgi:hypothetical protein
MRQHWSLKDVARLLKKKPYQVAYALSVGQVPEPELRIANKRVFQREDVQRLAKHFRVTLIDDVGNTSAVEASG